MYIDIFYGITFYNTVNRKHISLSKSQIQIYYCINFYILLISIQDMNIKCYVIYLKVYFPLK